MPRDDSLREARPALKSFSPKRDLSLLIALAMASALCYLAILVLSRRFDPEFAFRDRPIPVVLCLFGLAFVLYLIALRVAVRASELRDTIWIIGLSACAFRLILLPSTPIQEIDIYRYLWDGQAVTAGVNPYRYAPAQVRGVDADDSVPEELARLVERRDSSPAVRAILHRVHFGDLPTVYPPVSQAVFAVATWTTPQSADVYLRLVVMKTWLVLFDLATLWLVIALLRALKRPVGWSVAYGWCPLVIKEFANSGHLDAIAVCLTTAAVFLVVKAMSSDAPLRNRRWKIGFLLSAIVLGLAVGAKLYPIVLAPLLVSIAAKRAGWRWAVLSGMTFALVSGLLLSPMLHSRADDSVRRITAHQHLPRNPQAGLKAFLSRWEMNDFLFMLVVENLKPSAHVPPEKRPWFAIIPDSWRSGIVQAAFQLSSRCEYVAHHPQWRNHLIGHAAGFFAQPKGRMPFLLTRTATGIVFVALAIYWAVRTVRVDDESRSAIFLEALFLTLAWFWLLCPTQNPWYWIWAVPFLPFARSRVWLLMSGLVMLYYMRFWFAYHFTEPPTLGTRYSGPLFFDFVVTWLEYGPWFVALAWSGIRSWARFQSSSN